MAVSYGKRPKDDTIDMEYDLKMTLSIWELTVWIWEMTVSICSSWISMWDILSLCLQALRWARQHSCPWDESTCKSAVEAGHLRVFLWARGLRCPSDDIVAVYTGR
jgi:hypothetical protein